MYDKFFEMLTIINLSLVMLVDMHGNPRDESGENINSMFPHRQKNSIPVDMFVKRLHRRNSLCA